MTDVSNSIFDLLIVFVKYKKRLLFLTLLLMVLFYLGIRFFVDEKFESNVLLVPSQQESVAGIGGMLSSLKEDLPFNLGGLTSTGDLAYFRTIIFSRTNIDRLVYKFKLWNEFNIDTNKVGSKSNLRKAVVKMISVDENEEGAFSIIVETKKPEFSAKIANYVVNNLNSELVKMKTEKNRQNRIFLGKRLEKTQLDLRKAEDSLRLFQKKTGLYDVKSQVTEQLKTFLDLEAELISNQVQKSIFSRTLENANPQLKQFSITIEEFERKLKNLKNIGNQEGLILSLDTLPDNMLQFVRLFREVEIQNAILKFVLPLYEQTKFEEQKSIPYVQIVDYAVPADKKSYPPRTIFTLIFGVGVFFFQLIILFAKENSSLINNEKYKFIKNNLWKWK